MLKQNACHELVVICHIYMLLIASSLELLGLVKQDMTVNPETMAVTVALLHDGSSLLMWNIQQHYLSKIYTL